MSKLPPHTPPPRPRRPLANQISGVMVLILLLFVLVQGILVIVLVQRTLENHILHERRAIVAGIALPIGDFIATQRHEINHLIGYQTPEGKPLYTLDEGLALVLAENSHISEIMVVKMNGEVQAHLSRNNQLLLDNGFTLLQARWFLEAQTGKPYLSGLYRTPDNTPYIIFSQPLENATDPPLIVVARSELDILENILQRFNPDSFSWSYIMESSGQIITYSTTTTVFPPPAWLSEVNHPYQGRYTDPERGEILLATLPIQDTTWVVVNEVSTGVVVADLQQVSIPVIATFFVGSLVAFLLVRLLTRQITRPLYHLIEGAHQMEQGNYQYAFNQNYPSELGILASTFQHLQEVIAQRESDLRTANTALKIRTEELGILSRRTVSAEEEERRRVSRELHDGLGQTLTALKMLVDVAQQRHDLPRIHQLLAEATQIAEQAIDEVHTISQNLRPTVLDDLGLKAAMEWYLSQFQRRTGLTLRYNFEDLPPLDLTPEATITAYRFLQEALANIQKHAEASQVNLQFLVHPNYWLLSVQDDGKGFQRKELILQQNPDRLHLGLTSLQERLGLIGGELVIDSAIGEGTTLIALLPRAKKA